MHSQPGYYRVLKDSNSLPAFVFIAADSRPCCYLGGGTSGVGEYCDPATALPLAEMNPISHDEWVLFFTSEFRH